MASRSWNEASGYPRVLNCVERSEERTSNGFGRIVKQNYGGLKHNYPLYSLQPGLGKIDFAHIMAVSMMFEKSPCALI